MIEQTEYINAPITRVFEVIGHPENNKEWIPDVIESKKLTDGPSRPGSQFRFVSRAPFGFHIMAEAEIVAIDPPRLLEFRSTRGLAHKGRWELQPLNGGTCVRFRIEYRLTRFEALVLRAAGMKHFLAHHIQESVNALKRAAENGSLDRPSGDNPSPTPDVADN